MKAFNKRTGIISGFAALFAIIVLSSCGDNPSRIKTPDGPPTIERVSLVNKDSTLHEAGRGQMVLIIGKNFKATQSVSFNGAEARVNLALATKHNILVRVPDNAPFVNASNKLVVTNSAGSDSLPFHIVPPPPTIDNFSPSAGPAGQIVTINGSVFIGVDSVRFGNKVASIVSSTNNQIKVKVPKGISPPVHIFVTTEGGTNDTKNVFGFRYKIYGDKLNPAFQNYSYGVTINFNNTDHVAAGEHSIKLHYNGGYKAFLPHATPSFDLTPYDTLKISIYGGQKLGSGTVQVFFDTKSDNKYHVQLDVEKGKYKTFLIPFSEMGNPSKFNQLFVQDGGKGGFTIYIDNLGFL